MKISLPPQPPYGRDALGCFWDGLDMNASNSEQFHAGVIMLDTRDTAIRKVNEYRLRQAQIKAQPPQESGNKKLINWKLLLAIIVVAFVLKKFFNI
ncbi:hypothetical protein [Noviherbaspirillum soli]|uniref:hypothetical protein n=1 Tax=Noviherbaspirillum soli TaxID=1064518 RepID=UPI00188CB9F6|nr:hypothetical protein [Noviherbaspirillum soli]